MNTASSLARLAGPFATAASVALSTIAPAALAAPVVEQLPVGPNVGITWISQQGADTVRVLDDFQLAQGADIGRVTWRGAYLGPNATNGVVNTQQWIISFWSDASGGQPASYSVTLDASAVQRTSVAGGGFFGSTPVDVYDFDVTLPSAFNASAGATYWFSVMSKSDDPVPSVFGWTMAQGDWQQNKSVQQYIDTADNFVGAWAKEGDRAFALHAVPEPGTWALAGVALLGLAASRRRRQG